MLASACPEKFGRLPETSVTFADACHGKRYLMVYAKHLRCHLHCSNPDVPGYPPHPKSAVRVFHTVGHAISLYHQF